MRTIISIEKDSISYDDAKKIIDESGVGISEVISGGSKSDSSFGRRWARENNVPVKLFKPNRNEEMTAIAEALVGIWKNVEGEMKDLLSRANKKNLKIFITRV
jgi:antitoxin component of RelBE/YafQ-DinJ toxin-antitoxin module